MGQEPVRLAVGDVAPEIDAQATGDGRFSLSAARGRFVAVYFFPRSNTPG